MAPKIFLPDSVRCPHCGAALFCEESSIRCGGERRHCYDIAREGYVNLLPPGRAKNSHTGDGADMVRARREFLDLGYYDRYSAEAAAIAAKFVPSGDEVILIDAGCGEGRHTANMVHTLKESLGRSVVGIGFDASKHGAAAAAKRYARGSEEFFFAAANIFQMPVADESARVMTSLFAPLPEEEARRVLVPGGVLMICAAGPAHLSQMRDILYDTPIPSGGGAVMPDGFSVQAEEMIEYTVELDTAEAVQALFVMTPFYHNAPPRRSGKTGGAELSHRNGAGKVHCGNKGVRRPLNRRSYGRYSYSGAAHPFGVVPARGAMDFWGSPRIFL